MSTGDAVVEIQPGTGDESTAQEVLRNLQVLYGTVAGEQALDREFGIDGSIIDGPQENAQALLVAEYVRKTERYEPRAKVARVEWTADKAADGLMIPKVVIELVYTIAFTYWIGASDQKAVSEIQSRVSAAVEEFQTWQRKLGRDINPTELIAQLRAAGAKRVKLTAPDDTTVEKNELPKCTGATATYGGLEDD